MGLIICRWIDGKMKVSAVSLTRIQWIIRRHCDRKLCRLDEKEKLETMNKSQFGPKSVGHLAWIRLTSPKCPCTPFGTWSQHLKRAIPCRRSFWNNGSWEESRNVNHGFYFHFEYLQTGQKERKSLRIWKCENWSRGIERTSQFSL